jgi:hypothetical protein
MTTDIDTNPAALVFALTATMSMKIRSRKCVARRQANLNLDAESHQIEY